MVHLPSPDTQSILLLCASFGQDRQSLPQPLTLSEYNLLAGWLVENHMSPRDLLDPTSRDRLAKMSLDKLDTNRLIALLERGVMLSLAVEQWTNQGLWILGRGDSQYPKRLKQRLKHSAPPILYGVGNIELLSSGGLAVVGSRDVDEEALGYTHRVVTTSAGIGINVISGGARGVDRAAMLGVLEAGGTALGVLADSLTKAARTGNYRAAIKEGRLTLISAYDPNAGFNTGNAMGRNKYIYALADYALVVSCSFGKGGTWAGALEALKKIKDVPVFVRMQGIIPEGNQQLLLNGAKIFPEEPWNNSLLELLVTAASFVEESAIAPSSIQPSVELFTGVNQSSPKDIYEAILPLLLNHLDRPQNVKSLAKSLDVIPKQLQAWLNRAEKEGKVRKINKPVAYVVNQQPSLLSLLDQIE